jgi:hypothetical protein
MDRCPEIDHISALVGEELDQYEQAAVTTHLQRCPQCRSQVARISWLGRSLAAVKLPDTEPDTPHLSDLEVAAFATHSVRGEQAQYLEAHVARCAECAHLLVSVRKALSEYEDLFGPVGPPGDQASWWEHVRGDLGRVCSTWDRALAGAGALALYLGECALFAVVAVHVIYACIPWPPHYDGAPLLWPFILVPEGPIRFGVFAATCVVGALGLRALAGRLYHAARRSLS